MLDHMILTVSNVERSLAFYEAALKPLNIKFFLPYKGEGDHPDLWGFGDGKRAFFWIKQGNPDPASIHWGFMAENNGKVDEGNIGWCQGQYFTAGTIGILSGILCRRRI